MHSACMYQQLPSAPWLMSDGRGVLNTVQGASFLSGTRMLGGLRQSCTLHSRPTVAPPLMWSAESSGRKSGSTNGSRFWVKRQWSHTQSPSESCSRSQPVKRWYIGDTHTHTLAHTYRHWAKTHLEHVWTAHHNNFFVMSHEYWVCTSQSFHNNSDALSIILPPSSVNEICM